MTSDLKVVAIFGWRKGGTGALVDVFVNDRKLSSSSEGAELVSNPAHRAREMWWAAKLEVAPETVVTLDVKVGVKGSGRDSERTQVNRYVVREGAAIKEVFVPKVGFRHFPLLKGPFTILIEESDQDATDRKIEGMLEEIE
jgi:hypothetical protein